MPTPPPPPPPPQALGPPSMGAQDNRGMLLQSIRAGKTLKKTVTVDKSAPVIVGKTREDRCGTGGSARRTSGSDAPAAAPNLGGLFSSGMPKLRATGLRSDVTDKDIAVAAVPSTKRGPPPVPPSATLKPRVIAESESSTVEQPAVAISRGFGKPTLAPKPPIGASTGSLKPSPPPKKLNLAGGVSRAQSMRLPGSPPVLVPAAIPSTLHRSQDRLDETNLPLQQHHQQHRQPALINRALRPPIARPPSPPISNRGDSRMVAREHVPQQQQQQQIAPAVTTRVAPPPPLRLAVTAPTMPPPPPPPPYRSTSMHQRLAPPPPPPPLPSPPTPPMPPARVASAAASAALRNGAAPAYIDLEVRFADKFHSIVNFPNPALFRGFPKIYNSRNANKLANRAPHA